MEHIEQIEPTFLVVDDTEDNLDLLEFALKHKPVKMLRASSGKECLQIAAQKNPDVIFEGYLDADRMKNYSDKGYKIYFLPEQSLYNNQLFKIHITDSLAQPFFER